MKLINLVVTAIIDDSLRGEIEATIKEKLAYLSQDEIEKATRVYFDKDDANTPDCIKTVGLVVSYNKGQYRSTTQ